MSEELQDPITVSVVTDLDTEVLISSLVEGLTEDEMVEFVKDLDVAFADWGFSEKLHKYFKKQHKLFKQEEAELAENQKRRTQAFNFQAAKVAPFGLGFVGRVNVRR